MAEGRISKQVFQENEKRQIFRKTNIFYHLIRTSTCACQVVKNVRFSENLTGFIFLKHVLRFALLPYYRRIYVCSDSLCFIFVLMLPFASDWKKSSKNLNLFSVAQIRQLHLVLRSNWLSTCSAVLRVLHHNSATTTRWIEINLYVLSTDLFLLSDCL